MKIIDRIESLIDYGTKGLDNEEASNAEKDLIVISKEVRKLLAENKDLKENITKHALNYRKGKIKSLQAELEQLEVENEELKKQLKTCVCPNCGFGFEQAMKGKVSK